MELDPHSLLAHTLPMSILAVILHLLAYAAVAFHPGYPTPAVPAWLMAWH